jgi:hypothetical protein
MAMLEVACPGCNTKLKAPDTSAGKKAKCKKCGASFRLPGNPAGSAGESQMLSAVDVPAAEPNPFAFDALLAPPPPAPAPPKPAAKPLAATPEPAASDDPFNFGSFPAPEPPAPPPPPPPAAKKSTPKAAPVPEPKAKAKAKPKPAPPPALDPFADVPEAEPVQEILSLDDDEPAPAPAASGDPFAFSAEPMPAPRSHAEARPARAREEAPPEDTHRSGYRRSPQKSKAPLIAALLGLVALGAAVAVVVVVVTKKKDEPQAESKDKKKDEKKEPEATPENKDDANKDKEDKDARRDAKPSGKGGKGKSGGGKKSDPRASGPTVVQAPAESGGKGGGRPLLVFGDATRTIRFNPPAADAAPAKAAERRPLDLPLAAVRLAFPPHNKATSDTVFVVQLSAGFQGQGEKLALERFSPVGAKRGERLEFAGDGKPVPACDVTADTDLFAHAADGKLTVWKLADRSKVVDAWDVFADMPEHKKAGIAAVYFVTPETVATVTTAGAVHAWELASKKKLGEFVPKGGAPGRVLAGKSVARTADRAIVVVAVGGTIYQVGVKGMVGQAEGTVELGGDVGRSLGLAVSGNGKLLYVFETAPEARDDKKKERIVAAFPAGGRGQPTYLRWPEGVGEPESAGWANDEIAVVGTDKGRAFWFELSEGRFAALALLAPPGELGRHAAGEAGHWAVLPDPAAPGKAVLLEYAMPPEGYLELQEATMGGKPAPTLKLDSKGGGA